MRSSGFSAEMDYTRDCKHRARALLDTGNNRIWLVMAIAIWIAAAGAVFLFGGSIVYASDASLFTEQPSPLAMGLLLASYGLMLVLFLFVLIPLGVGALHTAQRIYQGDTVSVKDAFAAFSSFGKYFRFLKVGVYALLPLLMLIPILFLTLIALTGFSYEEIPGAMIVLQLFVVLVLLSTSAALFVLMLMLFRGRALTCVYMLRGMPLSLARTRMTEVRKGTGFGLFFYHVSFWGWIALSVATVGAFAVIDTVPYMLLCHQYACDSLITQDEMNQELKNKP